MPTTPKDALATHQVSFEYPRCRPENLAPRKVFSTHLGYLISAVLAINMILEHLVVIRIGY